MDRFTATLSRPDPRWPSLLRKQVAQDIPDAPPLDELRRSGKVHGEWPEEAARRYERERLEYADDLRAFWEVFDEFEDRAFRTVRRGIRIENAGWVAATGVAVRFTFPPGLIAETDDTSPGTPDEPTPPLPLAAPLGTSRPRFERRFGPSSLEGTPRGPETEYRFTRCTSHAQPDGSTILTYHVGPVAPGTSREGLSPVFNVTFPSWERVAPFDIAYEITADEMAPVRGTLHVEARVGPRELGGGDMVSAILGAYDQALGGAIGAALEGAFGGTVRGAVGAALEEARRFVDAFERPVSTPPKRGQQRAPSASSAPSGPVSQPQPAAPIAPPLAEGEAQYRVRMVDEVDDIQYDLTVAVRAVDSRGEPAWEVSSQAEPLGAPVTETVVLRASDLRPIAQDAVYAFVPFALRVEGDVAIGGVAMPAPHGRTFRLELPAAPFLESSSLYAALAAWPLRLGWEQLVHMYEDPDEPGQDPSFRPLRLHVVGEERVAVPAGTFECWIVSGAEPAGARREQERYWVSRGAPEGRAVVRARHRLAGPLPPYDVELVSLVRTAAPSAVASGPEARAEPAPAPLTVRVRPELSEAGEALLTRWTRPKPGDRSTVGSIEALVTQDLHEYPPVEELGRSGRTSSVAEESLRRYSRERQEYAEDLRAYWVLYDEFYDRVARSVRLILEVENAADSRASRVYVRLTFPPGLVVESDATSPRNPLKPEPPLPLTAPVDQRRKRFVRRFRPSWRDDPAEQHHSMGARPAGWTQFSEPDGSAVVTYGPRDVGPGTDWLDVLTVVFPSWEAVAPFTIAHEIASDWTAPARGERRINVRRSGIETVG